MTRRPADPVGELAEWQERVEEFVLGRIGDPPARVLEVGCGKGELARALARAGHYVIAIDPRAPEQAPEGGPVFRRARIEELFEPGPFDHVVANMSLHHVEDLRMAVGKIADLLRAEGTLVVVEFAWDRIDEATSEWALKRLPAASPPEKPSWLGRRWCRGGAPRGEGGSRDHGDHGHHGHHAEAHCAGRAGEEGLHDSRRVRAELGRRFVERHFEWVPLLYPDLADGVSEADESAAIEAGVINATGFRYVGTPAPYRG